MTKKYEIIKIIKDLNESRIEDQLHGMGIESSMCSKLFQSAFYEQMRKIEETNEMKSRYYNQYTKAWKGEWEEVA